MCQGPLVSKTTVGLKLKNLFQLVSEKNGGDYENTEHIEYNMTILSVIDIERQFELLMVFMSRPPLQLCISICRTNQFINYSATCH